MQDKDTQLEAWTGEFGDDYTQRNMPTEQNIQQRMAFLASIFAVLPSIPAQGEPNSVLEVGANVGANLRALEQLYKMHGKVINLHAVEPNESARKVLLSQDINMFKLIEGHAGKIDAPDASYDVVLTCGVLIHISPDKLPMALAEIYRVSKKFIICAEYFSPEARELEYRGQKGLLWARDYGDIWLKSHPGLRCCGLGFAWKRITGMDNLTWFAFEKVH
jgi:pseudaminic acid biosynthesis-associated methylase